MSCFDYIGDYMGLYLKIKWIFGAMLKFLQFVLLFWLCLIPYHLVWADTTYAQSEQELKFSEANKTLDAILKRLKEQNISHDDSYGVLQVLNQLQSQILSQQKSDNVMYQSLKQKITALDELSLGSGKDLPEVSKERKNLNAELSLYQEKLAQGAFILTKIDEANALIFASRNQELLSNLLTKQNALFEPQQFVASLHGFQHFFSEVSSSPRVWYSELTAYQKEQIAYQGFKLLMLMGVLLLVLIFLKKIILKRHISFYANLIRPNYLQKIKNVLYIFLTYALMPVVFLYVLKMASVQLLFQNSSLFEVLIANALLYLCYFILIKVLIYAVIAPDFPEWSLFENLDDKFAKRIYQTLMTALVPIMLIAFLQRVITLFPMQNDMVYSFQLLNNAVKAFAIIWVVLRILYRTQELSDEDANNDDFQRLSFSSQAALAIALFIGLSFGCSLFGYLQLSSYLINHFILSVAVIALIYVIKRLLLFLYHWFVHRRFWISAFRIRPRTLLNLLTPIIYCLALLFLLASWGVSVDILLTRTKGFLTGFHIGGVYVSISSICLGGLAFGIGMLLVKLLKNSLISGNLNKLDLDEGMKSSLISGIGFFGFIFAVILGIAVAGGSFRSLAIIAGAISFGAGFGLQNMVSNLASGLTILFERPIKVGDTVIINGFEGIVSKISMRATTLETSDKSNVIIPNALIISGCVVNKTYENRMTRVDIRVGVDYNCDIQKLKQLLLRIAQDDAEVLAFPAPTLAFLDFGDGQLNFVLSCFTSNITLSAGMAFRLREKIIDAFRKEGISLPYPQRIVHLEKNIS